MSPSPPIKEVHFRIDLTSEQYLDFYRGAARSVQVRSRDGRVVRFPATALQAYVDHAGVRGEFCLRMDAEHRLISLDRIGD